MNDDQHNELGERVSKLETRFETLTRNYMKLFDALQAKLGPLEPEAPKAPPALAIVEDATPCPLHPEAPQTANGCTAPGCTQGPQPTQEA